MKILANVGGNIEMVSLKSAFKAVLNHFDEKVKRFLKFIYFKTPRRHR